MKRHKTARETLIDLLDLLVSRIVIFRDKKCVTCGSTGTNKNRLGAGHLFSKNTNSTRWDLLNVHCQCWNCNWQHRIRDASKYTRWFVESYGCAAYKKLHDLYMKKGMYGKLSDLVTLERKLRRELKKLDPTAVI